MLFVKTLTDPLGADAEPARAGRYGVIETAGGRLTAIHLRPLAEDRLGTGE